jgi:hypothetical protein
MELLMSKRPRRRAEVDPREVLMAIMTDASLPAYVRVQAAKALMGSSRDDDKPDDPVSMRALELLAKRGDA